MSEAVKSADGARPALKQPPVWDEIPVCNVLMYKLTGKQKRQQKPLISFVSGATAGGVESVVTVCQGMFLPLVEKN